MIICGESSRTGSGSSADPQRATAGSADFPRGEGPTKEKIEGFLFFR